MISYTPSFDAYRLIARTRRRELPTRLAIACVGAGIVWSLGRLDLALAYLSLVGLSQSADHFAFRRFHSSASSSPPTRREVWWCMASSAQTTAVYSLLAVFVWLDAGAAGQSFAMVWLCGALLHIALHTHHDLGLAAAAAIPHASYFVGLPVYEALSKGVETAPRHILLFAVLLFLAHFAVGVKRLYASSRELRSAKQDEAQRREAAEAASAAKSEFLANTSHELRTPMNGVLGMAAVLERTNLTDEQRQMTQAIRGAGDSLMRILNDILDLSKIEASKVEIEKVPFRLKETCQRLERLHRAKAKEKGVEFKLECELEDEGLRQGDPHRVSQALHNLVSNAVKFTHQGQVVLSVKSDPESANDVVFEVRDTGIGMSAAQLKSVFEAFSQADSSTTRRYGGTGLGLSITKGLVECMGGQVNAESAPGEGSVFRIHLPLPVATDAGEKSEEETAEDDLRRLVSGPRLRILTAEDNALNQMVLKALLGPIDPELTIVENGVEALNAFRTATYDLILMDVQMPEMDGVQAATAIRALERETNATPIEIIALTANAMEHQVEGYREAGMNAHIAKPIDARQLFKAIATATRRRGRPPSPQDRTGSAENAA